MIPTLIALCLAFAPMPDFDGDGDVDQSDWAVMQLNLGQPAMPVSRLDLNNDGMIDGKDAEEFAKWERRPK